jgi:hypothetical protein
MSSLADMLNVKPKVDTAIETKKAAEAVITEAVKGQATKSPSLSNTKAVPVTGNPIDNDSLVKLTMDMADVKALLEGVDKRMKEGFAALLLKVTGGKPVDPSETEPLSYVEAGLPTRANVASQDLQEGGRGTRKRRALKKKRSRALRK